MQCSEKAPYWSHSGDVAMIILKSFSSFFLNAKMRKKWGFWDIFTAAAAPAAALRELAIKSALNSPNPSVQLKSFPCSLHLQVQPRVNLHSSFGEDIFLLSRAPPLNRSFLLPNSLCIRSFQNATFVSPVRHKGVCRQEPKCSRSDKKHTYRQCIHQWFLPNPQQKNCFQLSLFSKTYQCLLLIPQSFSLLYPTLSPILLSVHISLAVSFF